MVKVYDDGSSYAWTPEMGKDGIVIRISKSTVGSLGWCAQQMWLQHNYPKKPELVKHLVVGDDVHNGLDIFYQNLENSEAFYKIVKSGGKELAFELEEKGYDWIKQEANQNA